MPPSTPSPFSQDGERPADVGEALRILGHATDARPGIVVLRRRGGMLISVGVIESDFRVRHIAIWVGAGGLAIIDARGEHQPARGPSEGCRLAGMEADVLDTFAELGRNYLSRLEDVDTGVAEMMKRPQEAPLTDIMSLKRRVAVIRAEIGRTLTAIAELKGPEFRERFPSLASVISHVEEELLRLRDLTSGTQTSLTDIIMLRQADQSNRLAAMANELGRVSNRIADLANTSNIRMLGLSYVMLILAVVSTIILFPNTAATILGMPSAAPVPGIVVAAVLVATALVPMIWFLKQKWIRDLFRSMRKYEARVDEGMQGLKENVSSADRTKDPREIPR